MSNNTSWFVPGALLRINRYEFEDGGGDRDKYLIGLCANDEELFYIHTLTTSKSRGLNPGKSGCHVSGNIAYWCFEAQVPISDGFSFDLPTYVFFNGNIRKRSYAELEQMGKDGSAFGVQKLAQLTDDTLNRLLKCILKKKEHIPRNVLAYLEGTRESLNQER